MENKHEFGQLINTLLGLCHTAASGAAKKKKPLTRNPKKKYRRAGLRAFPNLVSPRQFRENRRRTTSNLMQNQHDFEQLIITLLICRPRAWAVKPRVSPGLLLLGRGVFFLKSKTGPLKCAQCAGGFQPPVFTSHKKSITNAASSKQKGACARWQSTWQLHGRAYANPAKFSN